MNRALHAARPGARQRGGALRVTLIAVAALVLLLVAALALVLSAPAGLAARALAAATPEARLLAPSGRVLAGSADLVVGERVLGRLAWDAEILLSLLSGALVADVTITEAGHDGRARLTLGPSGEFTITGLDAEVREETLDAILRPYAIEPSGVFELTAGNASGDALAQRVVHADATAHWTGGLVRYRLGGGSWTASFPPLDAELRMRDGAPVLVVHDDRGEELLDMALRSDGWADLRVRYRFVALAGYPWPDPPAPDVIVVEISEQVL